MFTGIIEEVGFIQELRFKRDSATITVSAKEIPADLKIGDSISVNGVCLTATGIGDGSFRNARAQQLQTGATGNED
jgi:riboflavin synthase